MLRDETLRTFAQFAVMSARRAVEEERGGEETTSEEERTRRKMATRRKAEAELKHQVSDACWRQMTDDARETALREIVSEALLARVAMREEEEKKEEER